MDCHLFRMLIQRYHDGELDAVGRSEYERHRGLCMECGRMDAEFAELFTALRGVPLLEPSAGFDARVMARVDVSRYRVPVPVKAMRACSAGWNRLPLLVRLAASVSAIITLFVTVYRPFLYYLLSIGERLAAITTSTLMVLRDFGDRSVIIVEYLKSTASYEAAWRAMLRAAQKLLGGIPLTYFAVTAAVFIAVLIIAAGRARFAGNKGETHVGML